MSALPSPTAMAPDRIQPDRILIVDDHSLVRDGMRSVLLHSFPACEILEAGDFAEAQAALGASGDDVDLVLLDLHIPDARRFSALDALREGWPAIPVVVISGSLEPGVVREALAHGAAGFIPKSLRSADILIALRQVLAGELFVAEGELPDHEADREDTAIRARIATLTPQQRVVLGKLVAGKLNKQIAWELDVSMTTVKAHVSAILQKLEVFSRTQAVILANRIGYSS